MIEFSLPPKISGGFMGRDKSPLRSHGFHQDSLKILKQVHGDRIVEIHRDEDLFRPDERQGDAIISSLRGVPIAVKSADCVPILMAHPAGIVAAVHAGWRGTAAGILRKTVRKLHEDYNLSLSELSAAIGPSICGRCYEVEGDVANHFASKEYSDFLKKKTKTKYLLDLKGCNRQQALQSGMDLKQVRIHEVCTQCRHQEYFSYRAAIKSGAGKAGRNYSWVYVRH